MKFVGREYAFSKLTIVSCMWINIGNDQACRLCTAFKHGPSPGFHASGQLHPFGMLSPYGVVCEECKDIYNYLGLGELTYEEKQKDMSCEF